MTLLLLGAGVQSVSTAPTYEFNFDEGNAASVTDGAPVRIVPNKTWNNQWAWYAIKHTALSGQTPSFAIAKADHINMTNNQWLACWSTAADTDTWTQFSTVTIGAVDLTFSNAAPFASNTIYIASLPVYPFSRTQRKIAEWSLNALVVETASTTNKIIANTTARAAPLGGITTAPALPMYGFKITSARHAYTKNISILTSGNHPNESSGRFALESAIDWLLAGSREASFLLDYFDFYVYPCLNPQGVYCGYFRSSPETPNLDNNRIWDTTGTNEAVDAFKTAMIADTGGTIEVGIDYHSAQSPSDAYLDVQTGDTTGLYDTYYDEMVALDATLDANLEANITTALRYLWKNTYSAALAVIFEQGGKSTRTVANFKASGENSVKAMANLLSDGQFTNNPGIGSRDFNGTTDRIDWSSAANLSGSALTISLWAYFDAVNVNQYMLCINNSLGTFGIIFANMGIATGSGSIQFTRGGTTDNLRYSLNSIVGTGAWIHLLATDTGVITDYTAIKLYKNGIEIEYAGGANGATEETFSGTWSLGGRTSDDIRNFNGKIAQVGVWNRVLTSTEIANLAAGQAPDLAAASNLLFYFKGNTVSLVATPPSGGSTGTADGTSSVTGVGNGPSIIYG